MDDVAPEMLVHVLVPAGEDCHWNVKPAAAGSVADANVKLLPAQIDVGPVAETEEIVAHWLLTV